MDDDDHDNVIQFPGKSDDDDDSALISCAREIMSESCEDPRKLKLAMIALAIISVNTMEEKTSDECRESILTENFPCSTSCGCYCQLISRSAFNIMFDKDEDGSSADLILSEFLETREIDKSKPRKPPEK